MTIRECNYTQKNFLLPTGTGCNTKIEITKLHRGHKLHEWKWQEALLNLHITVVLIPWYEQNAWQWETHNKSYYIKWWNRQRHNIKIFTKILKFSTDTKLSYFFNKCCTGTLHPSQWKLIRHWHNILLNSSLQFLTCCWACYRNCWHILNCRKFLKLKIFCTSASLQGQEGLLQFVYCWHTISLQDRRVVIADVLCLWVTEHKFQHHEHINA